jgi:NAD(P)-dependent dehydrogenase (short-subunit alcohol dehydrogenase family)
MPGAFEGKTVLVVGAASGIGRASAIWFAARGATLLAGDVDAAVAADDEFRRLGVLPQRCDARLEPDVRALTDRALRATGRIDVLVYSAGVSAMGQIPDVSEAVWDRCMDTNVKGAFLCAKHVVGPMARQGGGAIVNISSNAGLLPRAGDPVYSVSKAAILALTKALALCHAPQRIRVNALCPGPVGGTRMMDQDLAAAPDPARRRREVVAASPLAHAHGRMATVEEMADAIGWLADPAHAFLTGTALAVDGGKSLGVPPNFAATEI